MVSVVADLSGFWLPAMHYICEERRHIPCRRISPNYAVAVCSTPPFLALLHVGKPGRRAMWITPWYGIRFSMNCPRYGW
jgi:hypothetical protein